MLVFHRGGLGDFVVTWPLLMGLARVMPQCRLVLVVPGDHGRLAERVLRVEHRDLESGGWAPLHADGELAHRPAKLLDGARRIFHFTTSEPGVWEANVRGRVPQAELTTLRPPPRDLEDVAAGEFVLQQLQDDTIVGPTARGMYESLGRTGLLSRLHDADGPVVVHVGSGAVRKNWPIECWAELVGGLVRDGRPVRVVLGEVERERLDDTQVALLTASGGEIRRPADAVELLETYADAAAFCGHDTGPTHLAAACGLPTLALFGPATNPAVWQPRGPRVSVVRDPSNLRRLRADTVREALNAVLA